MDVQENALDRDAQEERAFFELFNEVAAIVNTERASPFEIAFGIEAVIARFRDHGPADACSIQNFTSYGDLLGYFYWSSPISAGVTRNKTLAALRGCEEFRSCLQRSSLKLVSVGGGTGSDLVGLFSAIYGHCQCEDLQVVLMDNNRHWKPFFDVIARTLYNGHFGYASRFFKRMEISTLFVRCDLSDRLDFVDFMDPLTGVDIVWMKGVLSILKDDAERHKVVENVIEAMTPGSLLVVIDSLAYVDFDRYNDRLLKIFQTDVGHNFNLQPFPTRYRLCTTTNQEITIFKKIDESIDVEK